VPAENTALAVHKFARNHDIGVIDFSPMGCQTGFNLAN